MNGDVDTACMAIRNMAVRISTVIRGIKNHRLRIFKNANMANNVPKRSFIIKIPVQKKTNQAFHQGPDIRY